MAAWVARALEFLERDAQLNQETHSVLCDTREHWTHPIAPAEQSTNAAESILLEDAPE